MITEHQRTAGIVIVIILFLLPSLYGQAQSNDSLFVEDMREEGIQFTQDNSIKLLMSGKEKFADMFEAIRQAKSSVHLEYFNFRNDSIAGLLFDILREKRKEGVEVRALFDGFGNDSNNRPLKKEHLEKLHADSINIYEFDPIRFPWVNHIWPRDHRKIVVIDGQIGYIGGMNIALRYVKGVKSQKGDGSCELWRDTMLRLEGPVAYALQRAFLVDWYFVDRTLITNRKYYPPFDESILQYGNLAQVVTSSPITLYPEIMQGYVRTILAARRYVYIETPYFLPNEPVLFALKTAAVGGVDVRIICPYRSDARFTDWASRSYLRELHEAGARVFLYKEGFMHSKLMVCDDALSTCGSTNVDFRSFENNFEANVFIYDEGTALRLKKVFQDDEDLSIALKDVPGRLHPTFFRRLWESLIRLLSPLL